MSNLAASPTPEACVCEPDSGPCLEAIPGRLSDLGGLAIRRLLPRSRRRLVGPWCFLDAFGPLSFPTGATPMDVAPHPHIGLQTLSWLVEGEVEHHDSLGATGRARPGMLNLMTAGRGIAHSEQTPRDAPGRLQGVQLWVALPEASRGVEPAFAQHSDLPRLALDAGTATLLMGRLGEARSPARAFSACVAADLDLPPQSQVSVPLDHDFEHALVVVRGNCTLGGQALAADILYCLGTRRRELALATADVACRALLLGGAPFGEDVLMWWNFVARSPDEIVAAREDWEAGRRFGEVRGYAGDRLEAPAWVARPVAGH